MVLEMNGPQLHSANMLEEVEFYRALFELYEGCGSSTRTPCYLLIEGGIRQSVQSRNRLGIASSWQVDAQGKTNDDW